MVYGAAGFYLAKKTHRIEGAGAKIIACFSALVVLFVHEVCANGAPVVRLAGNDRIVWVYRHGTDDSPKMHREFAYLRTSLGTDGAGNRVFVPLPIPPLRGSAESIAVVGTDLHVFFGDGTHRRYVPIDMHWNARTTPLQFPERGLPAGSLPQIVAGDSVQGVLYAVVASTVAMKLKPDSQSDENLTESTEQTPIPEPASRPASGDASDTYFFIIRYQQRKWVLDRPAPVDILPEGRIEALVAVDGVLHLFHRSSVSEAGLLHQYSTESNDPWSRPHSLPVSSDETLLDAAQAGQLAGTDEKVVLVVGRDRMADAGVRLLELTNGRWRATTFANGASKLRIDQGETLISPTSTAKRSVKPLLMRPGLPEQASLLVPKQRAVAVVGDHIAAAELDPEGRVRLGIWSRSSGQPATPLPSLSLFNMAWKPRTRATLKFATQYGILGLILAAVFIWRRDSVIRIASPPPGVALARFGPRLAAILLDLTILSPVWLPCVFMLWSREAQGLSLAEQLALGADLRFGWVIWTWAAIGVVVGMYSGICEATVGTTLGKRIFRLRVVGNDYQRCSFRAVVIRNLLRVVEFQFLPLAVLVVLTPARQRIGDIFARTLVVESHTLSTRSPDSDNFSA